MRLSFQSELIFFPKMHSASTLIIHYCLWCLYNFEVNIKQTTKKKHTLGIMNFGEEASVN